METNLKFLRYFCSFQRSCIRGIGEHRRPKLTDAKDSCAGLQEQITAREWASGDFMQWRYQAMCIMNETLKSVRQVQKYLAAFHQTEKENKKIIIKTGLG